MADQEPNTIDQQFYIAAITRPEVLDSPGRRKWYKGLMDVIRKKAGEDLERYRKIFRDRGHILTPDEENRFLESLPDLLLPKILFRLFFASELKEFSSNILVSASDRTAFLTAQDRKPEIIIRPVQMED